MQSTWTACMGLVDVARIQIIQAQIPAISLACMKIRLLSITIKKTLNCHQTLFHVRGWGLGMRLRSAPSYKRMMITRNMQLNPRWPMVFPDMYIYIPVLFLIASFVS